jgi:hypothetical protein
MWMSSALHVVLIRDAGNGYGVMSDDSDVISSGYGVMSYGYGVISNAYGVISNDTHPRRWWVE